jgi:hypothetical protein
MKASLPEYNYFKEMLNFMDLLGLKWFINDQNFDY